MLTYSTRLCDISQTGFSITQREDGISCNLWKVASQAWVERPEILPQFLIHGVLFRMLFYWRQLNGETLDASACVDYFCRCHNRIFVFWLE